MLDFLRQFLAPLVGILKTFLVAHLDEYIIKCLFLKGDAEPLKTLLVIVQFTHDVNQLVAEGIDTLIHHLADTSDGRCGYLVCIFTVVVLVYHLLQQLVIYLSTGAVGLAVFLDTPPQQFDKHLKTGVGQSHFLQFLLELFAVDVFGAAVSFQYDFHAAASDGFLHHLFHMAVHGLHAMLRVGHLAEEARYSHHALCPLCLFVLYQRLSLFVQCVLDDVVGTAHSLDMPQIFCLQGRILGCSLSRMAQDVFGGIVQELQSLHSVV